MHEINETSSVPFAIPSPTSTHVSTILPPSLLPSAVHPVVDLRTLLLQQNMLNYLEPHLMNSHQAALLNRQMTTDARHISQFNQNNYQVQYSNMVAGDPFHFHPPSVPLQVIGSSLYHRSRTSTVPLHLQPVPSAGHQSLIPPGAYRETNANDNTQYVTSPSSADDAMSAVDALSALALADLPKFTEQQEELERAAMTNEERAAALSDIFGKHCSIDSPKGKRARRDLDGETVAFLVRQMRAELEQVPKVRKEALLVALKKCEAFEFSDKRLELFLRCEGMNAKLAAQRFVDYWKGRREVFGPEKYTMRMTLSGALCDDLDAVESGVLCLLPSLEASGRQILYLEPHRRSRGQYSSESLLRAFWYIMEVCAQENNDSNSGFVCVTWMKGATTFDYDRSVYNRFLYFESSCFPAQCIGAHSCCPSSLVMRVTKPVLYAIMDKRARSCCRYHAVPEREILNVLSDYDIFNCHLPTQMGGTVQLDQSEWMANRRSVELEAIS